MSKHNPLDGSPDFLAVLTNALEQTPGAYAKPPSTGGTQISNRFSDERLALVDAICQQSGWKRNQVMSALLDRATYELFSRLSDETAKNILDHVSAKVAPAFDSASDLLNQVVSYNRFRLFPAPQQIREGNMPLALEMTWIAERIERDDDRIVFTSNRWNLPLHVSHFRRVVPDTVQDGKDTFKNAMLELDVQVVFVNDREIKLLPISDADSPIKRRRRRVRLDTVK